MQVKEVLEYFAKQYKEKQQEFVGHKIKSTFQNV